MEIIRLFKIILFRYYITKGFKLNTLDVLNYSNKINNLDDVIIYMDSILDLLKDDVEKIAKSKNIWFFDFDYLFIESGKILKNQLKKKHLSGIKKFYYSENIDIAISWMISRLINNMRNISSNPKYKDYIAVKIVHTDIQYHYIQNAKLDNVYKRLDETPLDEITVGLKKIYEKNQLYQDFDLEDFEELCDRYALNSIDIIGYDPRERPKVKAELTKSGNSQLILFFEDQTD